MYNYYYNVPSKETGSKYYTR